MLQSIARFSSESGGIEKTLKLLQSVSQLGESIGSPSSIQLAQWTTAKHQFALARRYFRLFSWIDCFTVAHAEYQTLFHGSSGTQPKRKDEKVPVGKLSNDTDTGDNIRLVLSVTKSSFLGMFLFMEMFTITNALSITSYSWGPTLQTEALKFWFYSLAVSVVLGIYELFVLGSDSTSETDNDNKQRVTRAQSQKKKTQRRSTPEKPSPDDRSAKRRAIYKQITISGCDLLIPGSILGWIPLDPVTTGVAGSISAVLGASDVWARVNP